MSWCAPAVGLGYGGGWWALTSLSQSSTSRLARLTMKASERACNLLVSVQAVMEFLQFFFFSIVCYVTSCTYCIFVVVKSQCYVSKMQSKH